MDRNAGIFISPLRTFGAELGAQAPSGLGGSASFRRGRQDLHFPLRAFKIGLGTQAPVCLLWFRLASPRTSRSSSPRCARSRPSPARWCDWPCRPGWRRCGFRDLRLPAARVQERARRAGAGRLLRSGWLRRGRRDNLLPPECAHRLRLESPMLGVITRPVVVAIVLIAYSSSSPLPRWGCSPRSRLSCSSHPPQALPRREGQRTPRPR